MLENEAFFGCFLAVIVVMYLVFWGRLVEKMRRSLWITKGMLAILPLNIIEKVQEIKQFLMQASQSAVSADQ